MIEAEIDICFVLLYHVKQKKICQLNNLRLLVKCEMQNIDAERS